MSKLKYTYDLNTLLNHYQEHFVYTKGRNSNTLHLVNKIALLEGIDLFRA